MLSELVLLVNSPQFGLTGTQNVVFFKQLQSALNYLHRLEKLQILTTILPEEIEKIYTFFLNTYDELMVLNAPNLFKSYN